MKIKIWSGAHHLTRNEGTEHKNRWKDGEKMIIINDSYAIDADQYSYVLCEKKIKAEGAKSPGSEYYSPIGYYQSLPELCLSLAKKQMLKKIGEREIESLEKAADIFRKIGKDIRHSIAVLPASLSKAQINEISPSSDQGMWEEADGD